MSVFYMCEVAGAAVGTRVGSGLRPRQGDPELEHLDTVPDLGL